MNNNSSTEARKGLGYALVCYAFWGLFPIYWYPINQSPISAEQVMAHRVLWSAVFCLSLLLWFKQGGVVWQSFRQPKLLATFMLSSILIGINWLVYLWAINNHHVLDASLGYFINPLFNILLGFVFFREKLNIWQIWAVVLALIGIVWLAFPAGQIPWVSLLLAFSFGTYALVRKTAPVDALPGLALETLLLLPLALVYLIWCGIQNNLVWTELNALQMAVMLGSGAATTIPLVLFAASARRISLSLLGVLQYLSPTLQMLCGVWLFNEALNGSRLTGFMWVWAGVVVFLFGAWRNTR
ncbi:MAG: EamA family transporter RarD [Alysiella sp.]|uniref:EamA family transporter RarD n=1 Tax=Alysiella sp. TaxID=1872483 RepID=UPI0026DB66AD|nr:EamA family transporter RarD [Alysiella sp.]MDO4433739.1 EamA family transporter RarD [Alysiella sp.]